MNTHFTQKPEGFIHRFIPVDEHKKTSAPTLLLLHGTGGNENDLLNLGRSLMPYANLLSPRGKTLENGMPRFFRRLAEGVFDEADLVNRTHELADFITAAADYYDFNNQNITTLGYSNGANIAASTLLLRPGVLSRAVLLRAMVPIIPPQTPDLKGTHIFMAAGEYDPLIPSANVEQLANMFKQYGADVELHTSDAGHQLTSGEIELARRWLIKSSP